MRVRLDHSTFAVALFVITTFVSPTTLALNASQKDQSISIEQKKTTARRMLQKRHTMTSTRPKKSTPVDIVIKPSRIKIVDAHNLPHHINVDNGFLDLEALRPSLLKKLSTNDLKQLLSYLATVPVKISWRDAEGSVHDIKDKRCKNKDYAHGPCNAAAALTLKVGLFSFKSGVKLAPKLFALMIATLPENTMPIFSGPLTGLLDINIATETLSQLMKNLESGNSTKIAQSASLLTEIYIKHHATKQGDNLAELLREIFTKAQKSMEKNPCAYGEQKTGLLLGSILSGMMKHALAIKDKDERNASIVNSVTNIIWAATSFIGMLSIATSVAAAAGGGVSMVAVVASVIYTELKAPRDFTPDIKEAQGQIELSILESAKKIDIERKIDTLMLLSWMRAAIHVNGLGD